MKPWERYSSGPWTRFKGVSSSDDGVAPFALPEEEPTPRFQTRGLGVPAPVLAPVVSRADTTDDARAERGFGRSAYLDDGMTPNLPTNTPTRRALADVQPQDYENRSMLGVTGDAVKRGALRTASSLPLGMATSDATALQDAARSDQDILWDTFKQFAGADAGRLRSLDISTPEKAAQALASTGAPAQNVNTFRQIYDQRLTRANDARQNRDVYVKRYLTNAESGGSLLERAYSIPMSDAAERMKERLAQDESFGGTLSALVSNPLDALAFLGEVGVESAPAIATSMATAAVTRNPVLSGVALGAGSAAQEFGASAYDVFQDAGLKIDSAEAAKAALDNPALWAAAGKRGATRATVIALFEMMGQGVAAQQLMKSKVGDAVVQTLAQIGTGAGGEAAAQFAAGEKLKGGEILIEGLAEGLTAPFEIGSAAIAGRREAGSTPPPNDRERINSPRLTDNDRASPIPNDIIDDGKAAVENLLSGRAPTAPQAGVAPLDETAPNVRTPTQDVVQRPLPTDRLSPTLGAAPSADALPQRPDTPQPATVGAFEDVPEMDGDTPTGRNVRVYEDGRVEFIDPQANQEQNAQTQEPVPQTQEPVAVSDVPEPFKANVFLENEDLTSIEADPETFQYKSGGDAEGVTDRLLGVKRWETDRSGQAIVYEYADGRRVIADGHQRLGLAKRLRAEGQDVSMPVTVFREVDGYTPEQIMVRAALKNVAESDAKDPNPEAIIDAAKVLRARPNITPADMNLPNGEKSALGRNALSLRNLSDEAFGMVVNERASMRSALAVANAVSDKAAQANILSVVEKSGARNRFEAEMVAKQAAADTVTQTQDSLFGSEDVTETLYLERARVMDQAIKRLRTEASAFKTILRNAGNIEGVGDNRVDRDASAQKAAEDAAAQEYITRLANSKGPISDALTEAARSLKAGGNTGQAVTSFVQAVRSGLQEGGAGREGRAIDGGNPEQVRGQQEGQVAPNAETGANADLPALDVDTASKALADARQTFDRLDANKKIEDAQEYFAASSALSQARDGMADALSERGGRIELKTANGLGAVITPRPDGKPGARITYFDGKGFSGDTSHDTLKAAVRDAIGQGYEIEAKGYLKNRQALWPKSKRTDVGETAPAQNTPTEGINAAPNEGFVVRDKDTGEVVMETRDQAKIDALNTDKYEAVPVRQHLAELNDTNSKTRKAAEQAPAAKKANPAVTKVNDIVAPDNAEGTGFYTNSGGDVQIDDLGNGDAEITITTSKTRYRGRAKETKENSQRLKYSEVKESLSPAARAAVEKIIGEQAASTEQTEAGTQNVIPGAEQSTERSEKARDADRKREADVRARQSKMRTGVPQDGPGGLFDTQGDMFDAPRQDAVPQQTAATGKIEDFGEKLEGAQKDKVKGWLDRAQEVADNEIVNVPLSKAWPEPDYQALIDEGFDPEAVAFMHAARDEIPNKPRQKWKVERWAQQVKVLRTFTSQIASGDIDIADVKARMTASMSGLRGRMALYEEYGHEKSLKDITLKEGAYSAFKGERFDKPRNIWTVRDKGNIVSHGATEAEAIAGFSEAYGDLGNLNERTKGTKFEIRKWRGGPVFIGKKVGKDWIEVETNPEWDWKDARAYLAENQEALEAKFKRMKELPPERGENNSPRVGVDHRNGQDVTPEMFSETFGFRGVQFGNYVEGPRRQADLNEAYDGLMDLAGIINVPPKAMSLNGTLGLAFGARGSGRKAKAHYEPDTVVINLTKGSGAGSLAHEWWHGLDHYFAMQGGKKDILLTEAGGRGLDDGIRPEVVAAFQNLITAVRQAELKVRSQQADKRKSKPYFSKMEEMTARAFESYVIGKLQDQSASNDYLANILSEDAWNALEAMAGQDKPSWPYVTVSEMPAFREAFDKLFDTIQTEETADGTVRLFQRQLDMFYSPLYRAIENAKQAKAPAGDWKAIIAKLPGVKKAETDWLGVEDWLDSQEGTQVSRDDLLAFVRDSQVEIVEDRLGGRPEGFDAAFEALRNDEASEGWSDADVEEQVLADAEIGGEYSPANFETYTEDGGDNYREILLRVPNLHESGKNKPPAADFGEVNRIQSQMDALLQDGQAPTELDADTYKEWKRLQNERNLAHAADVARRGENRKRPFVQSSHFEQENIVVHARVKDRVGPNGERVLFVEEIQSDLASKWRENTEAPEVTARRRELKDRKTQLEAQITAAQIRRNEAIDGLIRDLPSDSADVMRRDPRDAPRWGYMARGEINLPAGEDSKSLAVRRFVQAARKNDEFMNADSEQASLGREIEKVRSDILALGTEKRLPEGTPDTPFKEEHTYNLMVKRLLRMAAEEGYDQLSWTPGYMQAERWNSAAQSVVEGIEWDSAEIPGYRYVNIQMASGGQSFSVSVEPSGRIEGSTNRELEGKQLSSLVGRGLAKQIMTEQSGRADNQKITFPDSGYAIAYDQQTKRAVDKLVKKHGTQVRVDKSMPDMGAKFQADTVEGQRAKADAMSQSDLVDLGIETGAISESNGDAWRNSSKRLSQNLLKWQLDKMFPRTASVTKEGNPVWSVTITPELREAAMQPMAMFRQPSAQDAATVEAALPDLRKRLDKMMLKNVSLEAVQGATFQGAFEARGDDLRILVGQTQDGMKTVNHEAVHALRNMDLFTDKEWAALAAQAKAEWMDKYDIANRYDDLNAEAQIEEAIAEAFADFVAEQTEPGPIKSAFAKMRRMFRALKEWVTGNPSVQGVFEAVDSGRVGGRNAQSRGDSRSMQKAINTTTEAFKRWFGDSKVVDADGKPLVVYRGMSQDMKGDAFRVSDGGTFGEGIYLTSDPEYANIFADGEGGQVFPVYASIQNPAPQSLVETVEANATAQRRSSRAILADMGYDGMIAEDGEIVAFRPEQIKSVYNRGTFDPDDARILYQRPMSARQKAQETLDQMPRDVAVPNRAVFDELFTRNRGAFKNIGQAKSAIGDRMDVAREYMQDRILPLRRAQEAIERETGQPIAEAMNAYVKEETYHGKVGRRLEDIQQFTIEPISDLIADSNDLDTAKVNDYLTALHAEERNARIAKINPAMPDGGSGMTNAEAQKILKDAKMSKDYAALKEIDRLVSKLRDDTLQLRVDAGLMTAKDAAILKAMYKNYVPLKGFEDFDGSEVLSDRPNIGRGFSVKGPESKRALGRKSRSFDVLANILSQAQEVAIRAEKNRVGKAMFDLASQYPSENLWKVREVETKRVFNKQTGLVETRSEAPTARALAENEMAVKIDGKEYRIEFMDKRLTRAMGAVKVGQMGDLVRILSLPARYFSAVNTMIDPEFVVRNAFRDMQAAQINIRNFGEADRNRIAKGMIANWPKAFAAAYKGQGAKKPDTEWTQWYREFEEAGGKVSFWKMEDADRMKSDLDRQVFLKRGNIAQRAGKFAITPSAWFSAQDNAVLGFIERTNLAVDNAVRLAAYVEARKSGWSKQKAASLSKNLTVNFNRRGHYGPVMNALYPFYNAGMQGTQVLFRAMSNPKRMSKYVVGMIGVGFISDLINAAISDEDDDGVLAYDKIQKFKQEMSFQISTGDDVLTVPLSYGYNVFPYMGQLAGQVYRGVKDPDEAFVDFVDAAVSAFSPVYESDAMRTMLPMVLDLPYDLATNSDWLHRPIRPEQPYGDYGPDAYKFYGGASEWAKGLADVANRATGGTIAEPGMIDISPEYLDHIWGFASGGAGRFVSNTGDMAAKILSGKTDEIEGYRVPFARQVFSETGVFLDRDRYYRFRDEVNAAAEARETAQEAGEPLSKLSYDLSKLKNEVKLADKVLRAIRKERAAVGDDATADQRKEWEAREAKAILRFNQKYVDIAGASIE